MAGSSSTPFKPAPPTSKANVWAHFGFNCKPGTNEVVDKTKVVCKHCHTVLKYCNNTTNLRNHLARHHADLMQQKQSSVAKPDDAKQTQLDKAFHCKYPSGSVRAQKITRSVAVYICKDLHPYSVVDNVGFKYMVITLEPRYVIPTRKHITEVAIPNLYVEVNTEVLESLMSAEKVAITCDGWTSRATDPTSLAYTSETRSTHSETGHPVPPSSRSLEATRVAPGRDEAGLSSLPPAVAATITSARASSTRHLYVLKWNLFVNWCSSRGEDPRRCSIGVVLSFLQEGLERRLSPSTLKVYVAAIAASHDAVKGKSVGKHDLVIRYLRGARRLNPPRPPLVPSWDLSVVLSALQRPPFEPLQSVELKFLSMKTALLVALASIKKVGDLHAFSVDEACLEFGPAYSHVILRPRPGYVPKVPTTPFRDQVVNLQALPLEEADPALALLCPVRALRTYVDRTWCFRTSDQGRALSKQRLSHWIVDAIALAYQQQGRPCPLGVTAHSTRSVASSWALAHGASLTDICRAAGWATPNTFARFYNLRIEPVSTHVLASAGTGPA
ncbi:zinc finger BED domain-containing protein [Pimephales promelas]|nr:zinc finger BED domain-containing protein [Pimephales promelas]